MIHLLPESHVVTETCGDGLLVLDMEQAHYVVLDAVGARMWQTLRHTPEVSAAATELCAVYDADPAELEADVTEFAEYLVGLGLASHEPWTTALPTEPHLLMSGTAEDLYLDLLADTLLGVGASPSSPAEASPSEPTETHLVRLVRDLTVEAVKSEVDGGAIVLPAGLGYATALMAAGVLAAHQRWSWHVRVIPDDNNTLAPPQFAALGARLRLDRLCQWGWPSESDVATDVPILVWLPESADARSGWATIASRVAEGGLIVTDDVNTGLAPDLIEGHGPGTDGLTPLSWRAGWWRVSGRTLPG